MGNIFLQLWVVPGTSFGSPMDLTFTDCILYSALAGKRAELNPTQSTGLSLKQRAFRLPPFFPYGSPEPRLQKRHQE